MDWVVTVSEVVRKERKQDMRKGIAKSFVAYAKNEGYLEAIEMGASWIVALEGMAEFASKGERSKIAEILASVNHGIESIQNLNSLIEEKDIDPEEEEC